MYELIKTAETRQDAYNEAPWACIIVKNLGQPGYWAFEYRVDYITWRNGRLGYPYITDKRIFVK